MGAGIETLLKESDILNMNSEKNDYFEKIDYMTSNFEEINGYDFYRYIFSNNENKGEINTDYSKPNAIYLYEDDRDKGTKRRLRRRIMLNDTWENDYIEFVEENPQALCSGLSYRGRTNRIQHAQHMNALIFDIDGVGVSELDTLMYRFGKDSNILRALPVPTFVVVSGSGVHVYYVFKEPVDLFPNIKIQLKKLKYALTFNMWDYKSTSTEKEIQYQSINQGFRMVGSLNNKHENVTVRAFNTGKKTTLQELNKYVKEQDRVDINKRFKPSKMTRKQAKDKFPEWYQRVVIEKNRNQKKWDIKGKQGYALYEWWRRNVTYIKGGHRYFYLMCMSIYACKCDVPYRKLKKDMHKDLEILKEIDHSNDIDENDVQSALEAYDKAYYNFTIADIEKLTDIRINRNKRNYRPQAMHLKGARAVRDAFHENWRKGNGRPKKEELVKDYIAENPGLSVTQIAKELKISRPTIYKYIEKKAKVKEIKDCEKIKIEDV